MKTLQNFACCAVPAIMPGVVRAKKMEVWKMADLISRDALVDKSEILYQHTASGKIIPWSAVRVCAINNTPAVDAEPVRYAEWIPWEYNGKASKHLVTCSGCRRYQWPKNDVLAFDRCPKCGAFMKREKEEKTT